MINNKYFKNEVFNNNSIVEVPKDWEVKKTGDLLNGVVGTTPPKKDPNNFIGNLEWINISDMGSYLINSEKTVNRNAKGVKNRIIEKNSLLYSFKLSVGEIGFNKNEAMTNEAIISFSPSKNKNVNLKYFYYVLKKYLHLNAGANVYGAPIMNQEKIKDADLIVTEDIKEQNKIVEILDKQQSLIDLYKEKLSLLEEQESYYQDELLSGIIRIKLNSENEKGAIDKGFIVNGELVEGKEKEFEEWLSVNFKDKIEFYKENDFIEETINERIKNQKIPKNWKISKVKDFCEVVNGKAFKPSEWDKNKKGLKIVRIQNLKGNKEYNYYNGNYDPKYIINNNDLLFSWSATIASFIWQGEKSLLNQHIFKINLHDDFYKKYFLYILEEIANRANNDAHGGGGMVHIKKGTMENYKFLLPKNKLETLNIILILNNFKNQKNLIKEKIKIEEEKMDYLMDELLSGHIRVE